MEINQSANLGPGAPGCGCGSSVIHYGGMALALVAYLLYSHFMGGSSTMPPSGPPPNWQSPSSQQAPNSTDPGRRIPRRPDDPRNQNESFPEVPDLNPDGTVRGGPPRSSQNTSSTPYTPSVPNSSAPWSNTGSGNAAPRSSPTTAGGRRDLDADQRKHGHTLTKHVGRTDEQLLERLEQEPDISSASTYTDKDAAELTVGAALAKNEAKIKAWLERGGSQKLALDYIGDPQHPIGRTMHRDKTSHPCFNAKVVLEMDTRAKDGSYFVLTSYPEAR